MIEEITEEPEPYATVTIELYDDPDTDSHIPMMKMDFLEGFDITPTHIISIRDSVALCLYKMDIMIERADSLVILDE